MCQLGSQKLVSSQVLYRLHYLMYKYGGGKVWKISSCVVMRDVMHTGVTENLSLEALVQSLPTLATSPLVCNFLLKGRRNPLHVEQSY